MDPKTGLPMLRHRGPLAKAKPRKKLLDLNNEIETINRKLISVDINNGGLGPGDGTVHLPGDIEGLKYLIPAHSQQVLIALKHPVAEYNLNAMKQLRRFMCLDEVMDKTQKVIHLGILGRLREFLLHSTPAIQYETCWVLTNIAAGSSEDTRAVVEADLIGPLILLLKSPISQVQVQAAWTLGNIAGDNMDFSQRLLDEGIIKPLLGVVPRVKGMYRKETQSLHVVYGKKDWEELKKVFWFLEETLEYCQNDEVLMEACWALSRIFHGRDDCITELITTTVCIKLVELLKGQKPMLLNPVLRALTNITGDSKPEHTDVLLQANILTAFNRILNRRSSYSPQVVAEVLHCLSNIAAGTTAQKEAVSQAGLFEPVRCILNTGDAKCKREACHVLRNSVDRDATPEHFKNVVGPSGEVFGPLTAYIASSWDDPDILRQAIETINIIFSRGNEPEIKALYPFAVPNTNVYVTCMNYIDKQNFGNLWATYQRSRVDGDDLTPLLYRFSLKEEQKAVRGEKTSQISYPDLISPTKIVESELATMDLLRPGFSAQQFVVEQRLRKRISDDLMMMMETYLKAQVDQLLAEEQLIDGLTQSVGGIGFAA
ncbi:armadillo-type protein [Chytridium lagenaria]|nr:armadillo-type protein [Chytridium lagenaria]